MIELVAIEKKFKADFWDPEFYALNQVSFTIPENKVVGFLGANGAGKTTAIKIVMGFIKPTGGEVKFSKELGTTRSEILSNIGYFPERPYFYPYLTGQDFITYMGKLSNVPAPKIKERSKQWAERLGIEFALNRKVRKYSKGMLQRLGFLTALIHDPKVIILDEPLSGLDPVGRKEMKDAIQEVYGMGKTIFFSSHIVPDLEEVCDSVVFIEKGKLVYQGAIEALVHENIKPEFIIRTESIEGLSGYDTDKVIETKKSSYFNRYQVKADYKDQFLKILLEKDVAIEGLTQIKPKLEEIIYKVRPKDD